MKSRTEKWSGFVGNGKLDIGLFGWLECSSDKSSPFMRTAITTNVPSQWHQPDVRCTNKVVVAQGCFRLILLESDLSSKKRAEDVCFRSHHHSELCSEAHFAGRHDVSNEPGSC
jgi:hypothetical protein